METEAQEPLSPEVKRFIHALPKAELHVHIEGTLEPSLLFELAQRNGVEDLPYRTREEAQAAYNFSNLQSFLDLYYRGCTVLVNRQDFCDLTLDYLRRAHANNVRHVELFVDPQSHTVRGVSLDTIFSGLKDAIDRGQRDFGISVQIIVCFLRHEGGKAAMETLLQVLPYKQHITGVGLDSSENGHPPHLFTAVFERAAAEGLHCVAHAGEEGPPSYISEALDLLKVQRVDHGVRCVEDPKLVERLRRDQVPLTVCPLSNKKLKVYDGQLRERLKKLLSSGLCITFNSDDPAYFGGYMNENFEFACSLLGLSTRELIQIAKNGFKASFISEARKAEFCALVDSAAATSIACAVPAHTLNASDYERAKVQRLNAV